MRIRRLITFSKRNRKDLTIQEILIPTLQEKILQNNFVIRSNPKIISYSLTPPPSKSKY